MKYRALSVIAALVAATAIVACSESDSNSTNTAGGNSSATGGGSSTGGSSSSTTASAAGKGNATCKSAAEITASSGTPEAACNAFCVAEDACDPDTTVAACQEYRQCSKMNGGPTGCPEATMKYWDCMTAHSAACNMETCCEAQGTAMNGICNP